jgi:DNA-binding MarR family transcriptional regulator
MKRRPRAQPRIRQAEELLREQWLEWQRATEEVLKPFALDYEDIFPSQKFLARELTLGKVAVSRSLARLERGGYLRRRWCDWGDRRIRRTHTTDEGAALLTQCEVQFKRIRREMLLLTYA